MGTTLTAMQADAGQAFDYVVAIEGYDTLITSGSTAAAITAWASTVWTSAISGLVYDGASSQSLRPWSPDVEVGTATFSVTGNDSSTFGAAALRVTSSDATYETEVTAALDNESTTLTVTNTATFSGLTELYIGCERAAIASVDTATQITLTSRGNYHPFDDDMGSCTFGRYHRLMNLGDGVALPQKVSREATAWHSRMVGIWLHRKTADGTLDSQSQAQLIFAGRIIDVEDGADGSTTVHCEDVRSMIRDKVLMDQQFIGKAQEGIYLFPSPGMRFTAWDVEYDASPVTNYATDLVVTTGASGSYQLETGYYSLDELCSAISTWLAAALTDGDLTGTHLLSIVETEESGKRTRLRSTFPPATAVSCRVQIGMPVKVLEFLGIAYGGTEAIVNEGLGGSGVTPLTTTGSLPPFRIILGQQPDLPGYVITCSDYRGEVIDQEESLPASIDPYVTSAGTWAILEAGGQRFLAKYDGSGVFSGAIIPPALTPMGGLGRIGVLADEPGDLIVKQVVLLEGTFTDLVTKLLASTGTLDYNSTTYDKYDVQLGAGIPFTLLGDNFIDSLSAVDDASDGGTSFVELTKPTKLTEVLAADTLLRLAQIVWKNQGLQVTAWQTASALLSLHTLTEANKASGVGGDPQRTPSRLTKDHLRNIVKIEHNRQADGSYLDTTTITDVASVANNGGREVTISAMNSTGGAITVGQDIEQLRSGLLLRMPMLSRPIWFIRRPIAPTLFENVAPGDICTVTDDHARNPRTMVRGLSGHPGIIFSHTRNYATGFGEVIIALCFEDRTGAYCPAAEVDSTYTSGTFTAGYSSATAELRFQQHRHSESADAVDVSHFAVNDEVTIVEIDPATAASPDSWDRVIKTVDSVNSEVEFTVSLSAPAYSGSKKYRMISRNYSAATTTQKVDTYQADDADGLIVDVAAPYTYGTFAVGPITSATVTELPSRHATLAYGDGAPLDVGYERDAMAMANQLVQVKTALISPRLYSDTMVVGTSGSGYFLMEERMVFIGKQKLSGLYRLLTVAPFCRLSSAAVGTKNLRITLAKKRCTGDTNNGVSFTGPHVQAVVTVPASTAWATQTATTVSTAPVTDGLQGWCYVVVEAEPYVEYRGLATCELGTATA
jgi:hypothetical protein